MAKFVIIGDSHLKRNYTQTEGTAKVIARGELQAYRISEEYLSQFQDYDVYFILVGGNVSFHSTYNPLPKTAKQTADRLFSCLIFIEIRFRAPTFLKRLTLM